MFHYLFTNDLRISNLESFLIEAGRCFRDGCVPSASENKNANNNMNTLGFYFNLTNESNCAKECANGNVRKVVLNFIKKFQFPNPRTQESFKDAINDGIKIAPMRVILQALYMLNMMYPEQSYLTRKEIADYIFFNENVAKVEKPNIYELIKNIIDNRNPSSENDIPKDDKLLEQKGCYWKQCRRQVREMVKVLSWSGCVVENNDGSIKIYHDHLSRDNKADLFEIITYSDFWTPDYNKDADDNKASYQKYMDVNIEEDNDIEDLFSNVLKYNLYGIHIKGQNDALSDERPHICIGWSELGDLSSISTKEELNNKYDSVWPDTKPKSKGQNVGQIWCFKNDVKIGDYIIFADGSFCHIGRVESDYYFDSTKYDKQSKEYTNVRDVVWLKKNIKRTDLSKALHCSLMTPKSIWRINDYRSAVADLINGTYVKDEDISDELIEKTDGKEQKENFRNWMTSQTKSNGAPYSYNTINSYIGQMENGYDQFDKYEDCDSIFDIQDIDSLNNYTNYLFKTPGFEEFNEKAGNKACSCGLNKYKEFLSKQNLNETKLKYNTSLECDKPYNLIIFGAPGTGKSYKINQDKEELLKDGGAFERVTFHPDYSYANFVGTYKPVPYIDGEGKEAITYEYVPGPFMRVYVNALKNGRTDDVKPYVLIIEEINRANVAAVFGDVFQLLDRNENGVSEYPIQASEDMKKYLAKELGGIPSDYSKIKIPNNMFIWATMNSADQGVFPMDTAFKRRWDFTYLGIDDNDAEICGKYVLLSAKQSQKVEWNKLRKAINNFLAKEKINEDKQLGPYFIAKNIVVPKSGDEISRDKFISAFKNKVIMYLFEDAAKQKRSKIFEGCKDSGTRYSEICKAFDANGIEIFNQDIQNESEPEEFKENNSDSEE